MTRAVDEADHRTDAIDPEVDATVARLRRTFASGRTLDRRWRIRQLAALGRLIDEQHRVLTDAITADLGRDAVAAGLFDLVPVKSEVEYARKHLRSWMRDTKVATNLATSPGRAWVHHEPLGVALIIGPWNYPLHLVLAPLVAAIAAGDCAIVKPSELTPQCSRALADLIPRYLDPDAIAVVEGGGDATQSLIGHGLDLCFFTGSPAVGATVMEAAAKHLTPVVLELGGKSPTVVARDANVKLAAKRVAWGKVTNSGQTCVAPDYVLVDRRVREEFVGHLEKFLRKFTSGAELPILNRRHADRLRGLIRTSGGRIASGGEVDVDGARMRPAVVVDPSPGSDLMREEIFGPVVPVIAVDGVDDAVARVREGSKPLAAYLFSRSRSTQRRFAREVSAGGIVFNQVMTHLSVPGLPFGGVGTSGSGKYHGRWGFETFSNAKAVLRQSTRVDIPLIYPPYTKLKRRMLREGP